MKPASFTPSLGQIFVCTNRRADGDPLGTGCADRGEQVWSNTRQLVMRMGLGARLWVTRTQCQGLCPKQGCAVTLVPTGRILVEVTSNDAQSLVQTLLESRQ